MPKKSKNQKQESNLYFLILLLIITLIGFGIVVYLRNTQATF